MAKTSLDFMDPLLGGENGQSILGGYDDTSAFKYSRNPGTSPAGNSSP